MSSLSLIDDHVLRYLYACFSSIFDKFFFSKVLLFQNAQFMVGIVWKAYSIMHQLAFFNSGAPIKLLINQFTILSECVDFVVKFCVCFVFLVLLLMSSFVRLFVFSFFILNLHEWHEFIYVWTNVRSLLLFDVYCFRQDRSTAC